MIAATIRHLPDDPSSENSDLTFFLDFDMAILGQSQQGRPFFLHHNVDLTLIIEELTTVWVCAKQIESQV